MNKIGENEEKTLGIYYREFEGKRVEFKETDLTLYISIIDDQKNKKKKHIFIF
jgi:hypothetical protein